VLKFLSGRVARDGGWFSRLLNLLSLTYCRLTGLGVMEFYKIEITEDSESHPAVEET